MSELSIPDAWSVASLRDLIERKFTGPSPTCEERQIASDDEWGLLKTTAVTWDGWNEAAHKVPPRQYWGNKAIEVRAGDVLITKAGPRHRVGVVVHIVATEPRIMVSGKMVGLRPITAVVLPEILAGLLSTSEVQDYLDSRTTGMAESQTNFSDEALLSASIKVPPMSEQRRIAEILDTLDYQIRETEAVILKYNYQRSGLADKLVTRAVSLAAGGVEGWVSTTLGSIVREHGGLIQTGPFGSQLHSYDYVVEGVPVVMPQDINGGRISLDAIAQVTESTARSLARHRMLPGDVVFARRGDLSRCAEITWREKSWLCGTGCLLVRAPATVLRAGWLALVYRHELGQRHVRANAVGSTMANLNGSILAGLQIPLPPIEDQEAATDALSVQDTRIDLERQYLMKLRALKKGLMSDLLSGRVRVSTELAS